MNAFAFKVIDAINRDGGGESADAGTGSYDAATSVYHARTDRNRNARACSDHAERNCCRRREEHVALKKRRNGTHVWKH